MTRKMSLPALYTYSTYSTVGTVFPCHRRTELLKGAYCAPKESRQTRVGVFPASIAKVEKGEEKNSSILSPGVTLRARWRRRIVTHLESPLWRSPDCLIWMSWQKERERQIGEKPAMSKLRHKPFERFPPPPHFCRCHTIVNSQEIPWRSLWIPLVYAPTLGGSTGYPQGRFSLV